jgi:uncharacterized membrane protein
MPRSNPRSTKARNTAPSNSRGPNQPPTHLLRPSCNEAYGYLRTRLCRLRDSSHRGDVSVDFRGFHDTRTTSVPPQRCGTKARTWWVSGGMEGVIDGGADRDRLPRGGHGPTSQGRGQPTARSPDTARAIIRNCEGSIWVATNPYRLVVGIIWGMFLGMLAGLGFGTGLGVVVGGGLGAVIAKVDRSGIDRKFQGRVRGMLKPGTSTLVVLVNKGITDTVAEALSRHGGTILESSLSADAEWRLQEALLGRTTR